MLHSLYIFTLSNFVKIDNLINSNYFAVAWSHKFKYFLIISKKNERKVENIISLPIIIMECCETVFYKDDFYNNLELNFL